VSDVISSRMADALDEAVERMLAVMLKWSEDHRGPSNSWTQPIAKTVEILALSRVALAATQAASKQDGEDEPLTIGKVS